MRRFARSSTRFTRLVREPNSDDALFELGDVVDEAGIAAQRANRRLRPRVLDTVAGDRRRELADAFRRVHVQLLRQTDPEGYRRVVRRANARGS
jgi:hypothetical protein